jgi:O-antigen/teichoic acid export membrane protein
MHHLETKPLTLRRNFSWTFIGNVVYAACQWGMMVILAKLGSPEMVGQFTLGLAVTAPVVMLTNLNLRAVQATDAKHQYAFGDYLSLRLIATILVLPAIAIIVFTTGYRSEVSAIILLVGVSKSLEAISDIFYGLFQQYERMDRIAISMTIKGPLSLILLGLGVYLSKSVVWGVIGLAIAQTIVLLVYDLSSAIFMLKDRTKVRSLESSSLECAQKSTTGIKPSWNLGKSWMLLKLAIPLGCVMMLISLNISIPRYFIERYLGERELGIFAALAYLMVAGRLIIDALGQSAVARLAKYYLAGNSSSFRHLLLKLVAIALAIGTTAIVVASVAGKEILTLLYSSEYGDRADLFVWLMVVAAIDYVSSFLGHAMTAAQYFRIQTLLFATVTLTSALSCFLLLPSLGLQGIVFSLIIASLVQLFFSLGVIDYAICKIEQHKFDF